MKIAGIAEAAGVYCQVGSFSESRLGITALAHFSMVWDNIIYFDMDSPLMHSFDPVVGLTFKVDHLCPSILADDLAGLLLVKAHAQIGGQ